MTGWGRALVAVVAIFLRLLFFVGEDYARLLVPVDLGLPGELAAE